MGAKSERRAMVKARQATTVQRFLENLYMFAELCSQKEKEKCSQGVVTLSASLSQLCSLFMAVSAYL